MFCWIANVFGVTSAKMKSAIVMAMELTAFRLYAPYFGNELDWIRLTAGPIEVGVKFRSDVAGTVTGLRFYKGAGNTGTQSAIDTASAKLSIRPLTVEPSFAITRKISPGWPSANRPTVM